MRCENCNVGVSQEFAYAIKNNICPACGKTIMGTDKLAAFLSLQELLRNNFKELDAEKISSLIVSNFELKQLFKEELPKPKEVLVKTETTEVEEEENSDEEHKKKQIVEAKKILQEMRDKALEEDPDMRDEILNEAIAEQWGLGNANGLMSPEDIRVMADKEKKRLAQENIVSGSTGAFRRSS